MSGARNGNDATSSPRHASLGGHPFQQAVVDTYQGQTMTGAQSLVHSLEAIGLDVVFGIPGGAIRWIAIMR